MSLLHVECDRKTREVSLSFRKRSSAWISRDLAIALIAAVGIHLGSILLFRFPTLKMRQLSSVDASLVERVAPKDPTIAAQAAWTPRSQKPILTAEELLPQTPRPHLSAWTPATEVSQFYIASTPLVIPSFAQIERQVLERSKQPQVELRHTSRLAVHVSGPLASYSYHIDTLAEDVSLSTCLLCYDVRVDPASHAIAWFTLMKAEAEAAPEHIRLAEDVLQRLRFACPSCGLIPGQVEIRFEPQMDVSV